MSKKEEKSYKTMMRTMNFEESLSLADDGLSSQEMVSVGNPLLH